MKPQFFWRHYASIWSNQILTNKEYIDDWFLTHHIEVEKINFLERLRKSERLKKAT